MFRFSQAVQHQVRERTNLDNVDQADDSELRQQVKNVTGFDPEDSFLLKGRILYRENVTVHNGMNFDVYKGQFVGGENVAIKLYRERILNDGKGVRFVERMMRQAKSWTSFQSPFILQCYGVGMQITRATAGGHGSNDRFQL
jgi:serine/threonine-protein kinase RIO1